MRLFGMKREGKRKDALNFGQEYEIYLIVTED